MTVPAGCRVVTMGVSGSGKSLVGSRLAERLGCDFFDADELHTAENLTKMASGVPLEDEDRIPWLHAVGGRLAASQSVVTACSALKVEYRRLLADDAPGVVFVHLAADHDTLLERMRGRADHFMPPALLDSQLRTLEPLSEAEPGLTVDATDHVDSIVDLVVAWIGSRQSTQP